MTVQPDELSLAAEFPDPTRRQWRQLVEGVLRKAGRTDLTDTAAEDALATELHDGIPVTPALHRRGRHRGEEGLPGLAPFVRGGRPLGSPSPAGTSASGTPHPDAKRDQRGGARRPGERRHLAVAGPRRRRPAGRPPAGGPRRRPPRPRAGRARRRARTTTAAARALLRARRRARRLRAALGRPRRRPARAGGPYRRRRRTSTAAAELAALAAASIRGCARVIVDATAVPRRGRLRRGGARLLAGRRGRLPARADRGRAAGRERRSGSWSSATPPPPTSS